MQAQEIEGPRRARVSFGLAGHRFSKATRSWTMVSPYSGSANLSAILTHAYRLAVERARTQDAAKTGLVRKSRLKRQEGLDSSMGHPSLLRPSRTQSLVRRLVLSPEGRRPRVPNATSLHRSNLARSKSFRRLGAMVYIGRSPPRYGPLCLLAEWI